MSKKTTGAETPAIPPPSKEDVIILRKLVSDELEYVGSVIATNGKRSARLDAHLTAKKKSLEGWLQRINAVHPN